MLIEARGFTYQLPHRAAARGPMDLLVQGGITAVVGRAGAGASTWLQALAGRLPLGTSTGGSLRLGHLDALRATPAELALQTRLVTRNRLAPGTTSEHLEGWLTGAHLRREASDLGLADWLDRPVSTLPPDVHARLCVAELRHAPAVPVWLLDQLLTAADDLTQQWLVTAARERVLAGATVVWSDHALDPLWAAADRVVEFSAGRVVADVPARDWRPRTLPEPVLMAAARLAGLGPDNRRPASHVARALSALGARPQPAGPASSGAIDLLGIRVPAAKLGLVGECLELRAQETISILSLDERPEPLARRLVRALRGSAHLPSVLPGSLTVAELTRSWERRRGVPRGTVHLEQDLPDCPGDLQVGSLLAEEQAGVRLALSQAAPDPLWFPHPDLQLDPVLRRSLMREPALRGLRILTSRDVDLVVAASHRVLVVGGGEVLALRPPRAVLNLLPRRPRAAVATGLDVTTLAQLDPAFVLEVSR